MKKKPIYLWVLLILSALISATSLFGMLSPLPSKEALSAAQKQVAGVSAQQLEDQLNYTYRVAELTHSIFNMALIVLSAILVVVAIVFLVRKNLQYANYTYVGYVLLAIIGSIYSYVTLQDAVQLVHDETMRLGISVISQTVSIFYIVINVIFLALVFYKMWRQQKALAEEEETEELS
ncbi:ABC transporter permease [Streptococcus mitis]|uniref:ABC transporter permease n=1 Tax=Streptococcus mitis TaxID=28037 RepID=A0A7X1QW11_STRMT|nr:ABC transporter permease [Streptococcus mitis]MQQ02049.1 ABC transporter permease [Streptococcus mitis]